MESIVIVGASGHGKVVADVMRNEGRYHVAGFLDDSHSTGERYAGYPLLGSPQNLPHLVATHDLKGFVVAIGDNTVRSQVTQRIEALCPGLILVSTVHPAASIGADVSIGAGTVIMAGATVNPSVSVGRGCIVNTKASLDHDSVLGDFASLAPGVTTGGNCRIGAYAAIGIGAVLLHGVEVGEHTVVGAGSLVVRSVEPFVVAYGSPARSVRSRTRGEAYL